MTDQQFETLVSDALETFEKRLDAVVRSDNPFVDAVARHTTSAGGKRFRPGLVITAAQLFGGGDPEQVLRAGLVVELTHAASLYHDDVMDEAELRRGVSSANNAYGNSVAILVGDFLFARASSEVAALGPVYVDLQARTFAELVTGQIAETVGPADGVDAIEHHLAVIGGKTASLIRTSALFGGMVAGADPAQLDALAAYGWEIGMVFQLSDDLIDVISDTAGKTPGTDLREGIPTLPTLLLRASNDPADRALVAQIDDGLSDDAVLASVLAELRSNKVIDQVRAQIAERADAARTHLAPLPDGPAKDALAQLCDEVVRRSA